MKAADFPAPEWSTSDHEAGRVDDLTRVGNVIYVAGNFLDGPAARFAVFTAP